MNTPTRELMISKFVLITKDSIIVRENYFMTGLPIIIYTGYNLKSYTINRIIQIITKNTDEIYYYFDEKYREPLNANPKLTFEVLRTKYPDRTINNLIKNYEK